MDEPNGSVLGITPPLLYINKELLELCNFETHDSKVSLGLTQLGLQLLDIDSILYPFAQCFDLLLERFNTVIVSADMGLDGGQVVFERGHAHDKDPLLL